MKREGIQEEAPGAMTVDALELRMLGCLSDSELLVHVSSGTEGMRSAALRILEARCLDSVKTSAELDILHQAVNGAALASRVIRDALVEAVHREQKGKALQERKSMLQELTRLSRQDTMTTACSEAHAAAYVETWVQLGWRSMATRRVQLDDMERHYVVARTAYAKACAACEQGVHPGPQLSDAELAKALRDKQAWLEALKACTVLHSRVEALDVLCKQAPTGVSPLLIGPHTDKLLKEAASGGKSLKHATAEGVAAPKIAELAYLLVARAEELHQRIRKDGVPEAHALVDALGRTLLRAPELRAYDMQHTSWDKGLLRLPDPDGGDKTVGLEIEGLGRYNVIVRRVRTTHKQKVLESWKYATRVSVYTLEGALALALASNKVIWDALS